MRNTLTPHVMKTIGFGIIFFGIALTAFNAFTFFTKEKVVEIGSLEITHSNAHHLNWSPYLGVSLIIAGALVIWYSVKNKSAS
jgi:hypothetical protein